MQIHIYLDKQTVNNSFLVAFFTRTCHVILMKTIAYITVTLNQNIIERHELFDSLFSHNNNKGRRHSGISTKIKISHPLTQVYIFSRRGSWLVATPSLRSDVAFSSLRCWLFLSYLLEFFILFYRKVGCLPIKRLLAIYLR